MRQIAGSFAKYETATPRSKRKAARERKRATSEKCEGARAGRNQSGASSPKGHERSLRDVALTHAAHEVGFEVQSRHKLRTVTWQLIGALHVLAYNLTRVMNIVGIQPLMAAIRA